jgi:TolB-like protein
VPPAPRVFAPGPERPTVAVLPFEPIDGDGRLARSLTEEVVTSLAHLRSVVLTREARYHLRGAVRERGRYARVTLRLIDAATGRLLWADRQDGAVDDLFGFEERIAIAVSRAIDSNVRAAEIARVQGKDIAELTAYELTLRALPAAMAFDPAAGTAALELLERAIELAPNDARPAALAAWCHVQRAAHHFTGSPARERETALTLAERAGRLQSGDPLALTVLSGVYTFLHDLTTADMLVEQALRLDSGSAWAWGRSAWIHCYRGEAAEALERFQLALDLAPGDPLTFLNHLGLAASLFLDARYDESARWFTRGIAEHPKALWANRFLAPAYALSGCRDEARRSCAVLLGAFPDLTIAQVRTGLPFTRSHLERILEGLERAGMPRG